VSFQESELMPSTEKEEKYVVKAIIDKKRENNKTYYKIWWKGYLKKDATWVDKASLINDGLLRLIQEYENSKR
jgi:hypothetical protein